ncbi:MAG: acetolactate decarboxylase [Hyphomicrobiaceae bacterium]
MRHQTHALTQVSTLSALLNGIYDGEVTLSELLTHGDFGIGTFDHLDGEMVVLDGRVYQVKDNGDVVQPNFSLTTPFAVVTKFEANEAHELRRSMTFCRFEADEDKRLPTKNIFHAIRIDGAFEKMTCRSVSRQEKPYPPLSEVAKKESIFEFKDVSGTLVGFRCPQYAAGINLPGYHLHFISDDRTMGGHVLDFTIRSGVVKADYTPDFSMMLPEKGAFYLTDFEESCETKIGEIERGVPNEAKIVIHR